MSAIHVPGSTAQLVDRASALITQLRSAVSGGFTTPEGVARGEEAAIQLTAVSRELRMHMRQIGAEARREARERSAA